MPDSEEEDYECDSRLKEMPLTRKASSVTSCPAETNILALIQRLLCWRAHGSWNQSWRRSRVCILILIMLDTDHYADSGSRSQRKLNDPTADEFDSSDSEGQSSIPKKSSKLSSKVPKGQKAQKKSKENALPIFKPEKQGCG